MQRIVTNLQAVEKSRGLSLPPQLHPPAAALPGATADKGDSSGGSSSKEESSGGGISGEDGSGSEGGSSAAGGGSSNGLPLSVLLGGSLVDRMDLLGRTGGLPAAGHAVVLHACCSCSQLRRTAAAVY